MKILKEAREERGIKQIAVANALKASRQTYARCEENPHDMTVLQAEAACKFRVKGKFVMTKPLYIPS